MLASILGIVAPVVFRLLEKQLGPRTGATKMQTAIEACAPILERLAAAGKLGGPAPAADELRQILEQLLAQERAKPDWQESGTLAVAGQTFVVTVVGRIS